MFQLLRSSLVNNKTQAVVCDDLGMTKYAIYANPKVEMKIKDRADLLEAFLAALYVDSVSDVSETGSFTALLNFSWISGFGNMQSFLRCLLLSPFAGFHHESRLERPEVKIATMLSDSEDFRWRRARHSNLQVGRISVQFQTLANN